MILFYDSLILRFNPIPRRVTNGGEESHYATVSERLLSIIYRQDMEGHTSNTNSKTSSSVRQVRKVLCISCRRIVACRTVLFVHSSKCIYVYVFSILYYFSVILIFSVLSCSKFTGKELIVEKIQMPNFWWNSELEECCKVGFKSKGLSQRSRNRLEFGEFHEK